MKVIHLDGVTVVVPGVPRLDASRAEDLRSTLQSAMTASCGSLLLDLQSVELVDSTILGVVVGIFRNLPKGGRLALCAVGENVGSLLHLTNLDKIFSLYSTREEAISAMR